MIAQSTRRGVIQAAGGIAGVIALGRAPAFAQAAPKKLVFAHAIAAPETGAVHFDWFAREVTAQSKGGLVVEFHAGTLLNKEIDIMNAVKAGNIDIGDPAGAAATVFPEMGVFLVPYLIASYGQAYTMFNGAVGEQMDRSFQDKYGLKVLTFFDYGFRHFFTTKRAINEPRDLRGLKIRVQLAKIFADTINGLGGAAVPMGWAEVITAAQQGVIDGADLPVANMEPLKAYEVSKFYSLTAHNYGPTVTTMNLASWNGLTPGQRTLVLDVARATQERLRQTTESVDNLAAARKILEPRGMTVSAPDIEAFRRVAMEKVWPSYQRQFPEMWEKIVATKA